MIKLSGIKKSYNMGKSNEYKALKEISLEISDGECVAIMGKSGAGKSTLLHILGGVDQPTSGTVTISGTDMHSLNEDKLAIFRRRQIGLIYQFYNLLPVLNVEENILLPYLLDGRKLEQERLDQMIEMLGLSERRNNLPSQLSGGQQQRVAIARALIYRPAILLADEPTGNLDQKNSKEIIEMLKISNRNLEQTIVLITHDEKIALEADRIITIEDGRIVSEQKRR